MINKKILTIAALLFLIVGTVAYANEQGSSSVSGQVNSTAQPARTLNSSWPSHVPLELKCDNVQANLRQNARGESVRVLQQILKDKGYLESDNVSGFYGPVTREAVRKFQKDNGLEQVGFVGPKTRALFMAKCGNALQNPPFRPQDTQGPVPIGNYVPQDTSKPIKDDMGITIPAPVREPLKAPISNTTEVERRATMYEKQFGLSLSDTIQAAVCAPAPLRGDMNGDGVVNTADLVILGDNYNKQIPSQYAAADVDADGYVKFAELVALAQNWGKNTCAN